MPNYVDGFVVPVPKKNVAAYKKIAKKAGKIWIEHGALEFRECVLDDADKSPMVPFTRGIKVKPGETVFFSWILYKSKAHRNQVNKKVMADPRLTMEVNAMPFDHTRMLYNGFKVLVDGK